MPRPQRELDPNGGALVAFARDLRALRAQAGSPKFATMERRVGRSKSTLADAAGGQRLPRWETVADFVRACGADPAPWRPRWEQLRRELGVPGTEQTPAVELEAGEREAGIDAGLEADPARVVAAPTTTATPPEHENSPAAAATGSVTGVAAATPRAEPPDVPAAIGSTTSSGATNTVPVQRRWSGRTVVLVAALAAVVFGLGAFVGRATGPQVAGPYVRAIEVQNKVALGSNLLVEDRTPAYLSSSPIAYCAARDRNCKVAGTEMGSGSGIVAHCVTHGQEMHNFNLNEAAAASNSDRSTSDVWYRASFPDGRTGFISEVYLSASSRGGLGLPDCGPGVPAPAPVPAPIPAATVR